MSPGMRVAIARARARHFADRVDAACRRLAMTQVGVVDRAGNVELVALTHERCASCFRFFDWDPVFEGDYPHSTEPKFCSELCRSHDAHRIDHGNRRCETCNAARVPADDDLCRSCGHLQGDLA